MKWEREFFSLAGCVLDCRLAGLNPGESLSGHVYDPIAVFVGELTYAAEMHYVLKDAGMLRRQRLERCARRVLQRGFQSQTTIGEVPVTPH